MVDENGRSVQYSNLYFTEIMNIVFVEYVDTTMTVLCSLGKSVYHRDY